MSENPKDYKEIARFDCSLLWENTDYLRQHLPWLYNANGNMKYDYQLWIEGKSYVIYQYIKQPSWPYLTKPNPQATHHK